MTDERIEEAFYDYVITYNNKRVEKKVEHIVSIRAVDAVLKTLTEKVGSDNIHKIDICRQLTLVNGDEITSAKTYLSIQHYYRIRNTQTMLDEIDKKLALNLKDSLLKEYKLNNKPKPVKCGLCGQLTALQELYEAVDKYESLPTDHTIGDIRIAFDEVRSVYYKLKEIKDNGKT